MDVGEVNISVGLGSDVALECDVLPSSPPPVIQWLEGDVNGENFSPVTDTPDTNLIHFLEGGRYLFYSFPLVDESRLMSTYRCRVTNALLDRTRLAPTTYRLVSNLPEGAEIDYKTIGDLTGFVGDTDFEFSYVGGFHTGVEGGVNSTDITYLINGNDIATNSMGVELRNIARLNQLILIGRFNLTAEVRRGGVNEPKTGTLTVRRKLIMFSFMTDMSHVFLVLFQSDRPLLVALMMTGRLYWERKIRCTHVSLKAILFPPSRGTSMAAPSRLTVV